MLNSPVDVAILFGVALLIFGPKRLPELGKSLGQGLGNFKKSLTDAQDEVKSAMRTESTGQTEESAQTSAKSPAPAAASTTAAHSGDDCCPPGR